MKTKSVPRRRLSARHRVLPAQVCPYVLVAVVLATSSASVAHEGLHEAIADATSRIAKEPRRAELYLQRGEFHRLHADWDAAMADYERAANLDPALAEVDYARGRMLTDAGWLQSAELILSKFIEKRPNQAKGHDTLAQVMERRGQHDKAAAEFSKAIQLSTPPTPELYIARARAVAAIDDARIPEAIRGLDEGIKRLGPIVTLQSFAIELELHREQYDAALTRLQTLMDQSQRKERWLIQRGDILRHAGRGDEARRAFHEALEAIDRLTPPRRSSDAVVDLRKHAQSALKELDAGTATRPAERGN